MADAYAVLQRERRERGWPELKSIEEFEDAIARWGFALEEVYPILQRVMLHYGRAPHRPRGGIFALAAHLVYTVHCCCYDNGMDGPPQWPWDKDQETGAVPRCFVFLIRLAAWVGRARLRVRRR